MELFILGGFLGTILGMFLMACLSINSINDYEKTLKEKQSLINASRKILEEAEDKVEKRTKLIKDLQQTNREQRETIEEQEILISDILNKTLTYMVGHERKTLDVIKETIRDYRQPSIKKEVITSDQTANNF